MGKKFILIETHIKTDNNLLYRICCEKIVIKEKKMFGAYHNLDVLDFLVKCILLFL